MVLMCRGDRCCGADDFIIYRLQICISQNGLKAAFSHILFFAVEYDYLLVVVSVVASESK